MDEHQTVCGIERSLISSLQSRHDNSKERIKSPVGKQLWICLMILALLITSSIARAGDRVTNGEIEKIVKTIPMRPAWRTLEIDSFDPISIILNFREHPTELQVQGDAKYVVGEILHGLVSRGYSPQKDWLSVYVFAQQNGLTTVTGQPGVRPFGKAYYDFNRDIVVWDAPDR